MGSAFGTTGLSVLATLALVAAAILTVIADDRLRDIAGFDSNDSLQQAHNHLIVSIIAGWIAAGLAFLLMLGYLITAFKLLNNEWLHLFVWILAVAAAVVSLIWLGLAMRSIGNNQEDNETRGLILWAMITTGIGLVLLVFLGMWRLTHHGTVYPTKAEVSGEETNGSKTYMIHETGAGNGESAGGVPPVHGQPAEVPVPTDDY